MHLDHLGSSNIITDETGNKVSQYEYEPYGQVSKQTGTDVTNYKFTGKELDSTGLYYYGARYYDPQIGRFIQADTIVQSPFDPQTLNRYSYCRNNPLIYVDPSGHFFGPLIAAIFAIAKAAVVGAVIGVAVSAATGGDIGQGAITGAIGGALFWGAGEVIGGLTKAFELQKFAATVVGSGVHTIAGAASGSLGALATGGDPGMSAAIGAASAGASYFIGNTVPFLREVKGKFLGNLVKRSAIGALVGGGVSSAFGGDFGSGARYGAISSAIGYTCNEAMHGLERSFIDILEFNTQQRAKFEQKETNRWSIKGGYVEFPSGVFLDISPGAELTVSYLQADTFGYLIYGLESSSPMTMGAGGIAFGELTSATIKYDPHSVHMWVTETDASPADFKEILLNELGWRLL